MQLRYDLRKENDGTWTVLDIFVGLPVVIGDTAMIGLEVEEADDLADLLNLQDMKRRKPVN